MKTLTKIKTVALAVAFAGIALTGCKKDALANEGQSSNMGARPTYPNVATGAITIDLTSTTPAPYGAVNVDIIGVVVHYVSTQDSRGYVALPVRPRLFDLIQLKNTSVTVALKNLMAVGRIDQVRLILGTENSFVVGDNIGRHFHHLFIPDTKYVVNVAVDTGIELNRNTVITLDFNANSSIVPSLKGLFFLVPDVTLVSIP